MSFKVRLSVVSYWFLRARLCFAPMLTLTFSASSVRSITRLITVISVTLFYPSFFLSFSFVSVSFNSVLSLMSDLPVTETF